MSQFITVSKAAELLCLHALPPGEDRRSFRNKITERIKRKVKKGRIRAKGDKKEVFANDLIHAGDFARVFEPIYSVSLNLTIKPEVVSATCNARLPRLNMGRLSASILIPPNNLQACQEALAKHHQTIDKMKCRIAELESEMDAKVKSMQAEIDALRQHEEWRRAISEKNRVNAKKPRK